MPKPDDSAPPVPHVPVLSFDELAPQFTITDLGAIRVAQDS